MKLELLEKNIIEIYQNSKNEKIVNANQFQNIIQMKTRFIEILRFKKVNLDENIDYYKIYNTKKYGENLTKKVCEYYITEETAQKLCFLSKSEICIKLQKEILKNKEKSFLEILKSEIDTIKQEQRIEDIEEITIEDEEYPEQLRKIKNPPQKLYIKGNKELLKQNGIAVIGSRTISNYGSRMCKIFVNNLVGYNLNIISGLAKGMDATVHKNCIEAKGKTIAVLPCGLKNIYPKRNEELYNKILETGGLIVSEYELDEEESSEHFRQRNRIVAGLAIGTLVIESHRKSGTSITVRNTEEQNKKSFCIPSSLENSKGSGNNEMIRDKRAKLVITVEDIIEEYAELHLQKKENFKFLDIKEEKEKASSNNQEIEKSEIANETKIIEEVKISEENLEVYKAIEEGANTIDEIARKIGKSINEVSYKITMLELENAIEEMPGKRFKIKAINKIT